jgi:hypothetical protein
MSAIVQFVDRYRFMAINIKNNVSVCARRQERIFLEIIILSLLTAAKYIDLHKKPYRD